MTFDISYRYLIDPADTREALLAFADQPIIGLDTETFFDFAAGQNRLSLLQLAAPTGEVLVIDGLTAGIGEARPLVENPRAMMAAHNARFDDGVLRGAGFAVAGMVDTLRMARRTLKLHSFSLASVSAHLFDLPLDKTQQRSDWRRRPLSRVQLDYAALDAKVALRVYQELAAQLEREGRLEMELRRARIGPREDGDNLPAAKRTKRPPIQLRPLTAEERQLVESLRQWRKQAAQIEYLPVYMICTDKTLDHLAIVRPRTMEELGGIYGLGPAKIAKYGEELLERMR
jgi:ribonuclease D